MFPSVAQEESVCSRSVAEIAQLVEQLIRNE